MNLEARARKALVYVKQMLDKRAIEGDDTAIGTIHNCPGFISGMRRGEHFAIVFVQNINKAAVNAIVDFCDPPATDDGDEEHPHAGNLISQAIVVFTEKCTVMATKDLEANESVVFERFQIDELMRIPLVFSFCQSCRLLTEREAREVTTETALNLLPKIWTTDPLQRIYNAPVGSIFEIVEKYGVLQPVKKFRVVTAQSC